MIKSIERRNLVEEIVAQLKDNILSGKWPTGFLIPSEPELSRLFNVSRNTVRSAVQELVAHGVLVKRQGVGTSVSENLTENLLGMSIPFALLSQKELVDVLEFRRVIEMESAVLACERADAANLDELRASIAKLRASVEVPLDFAVADYEMHVCLAKASHNVMFIRVMQQLKDVIFQHMTEAVTLTDISRSLERHSRLIDAVVERQASKARRIMAEHFDVLIDYFDGDSASS
ncbi:MAG: FadR/GntR family transcriptional regulator [Treponemataceae bacterium]